MGDVAGLFNTIGSGLGTAASDVGSAVSDIGSNVGGALSTGANDLATGAQSLVGNLGQGFGGLFGLDGGGGPISPGTIANPGAGSLATSAAGAAAPAATTGAGAFSMAPGANLDPSIAAPPSIPAMDGSTIPSVTAPGAVAPDFTSLGLGNPTPGNGVMAPNLGMPGSPAAPAGGGSGFLQSLLNPKTALPLGLLGTDLIMGSQTPGEVKTLKQMAAEQGGLAAKEGQLATAEQEGLLPTGAEQKVDLTLKANEAAIRTKYAQMGMSGSTAEAQDLQAARDQAMSQTFEIGSQLASQGLATAQAATGQQSALLAAILAQEQAQGGDMANALAEFAAAAAH